MEYTRHFSPKPQTSLFANWQEKSLRQDENAHFACQRTRLIYLADLRRDRWSTWQLRWRRPLDEYKQSTSMNQRFG
jgi:hypothetical protein